MHYFPLRNRILGASGSHGVILGSWGALTVPTFDILYSPGKVGGGAPPNETTARLKNKDRPIASV